VVTSFVSASDPSHASATRPLLPAMTNGKTVDLLPLPVEIFLGADQFSP